MANALASQLGKPVLRIDGVAKVSGAARFPSDEPVRNPAFAYLITSKIARGRIEAFHLEAAHAVPGVLDILTYQNIGSGFEAPMGPDGKPTTTTLESSQVWHAGQIIGIVLADTFEAAREAANKATTGAVKCGSDKNVHDVRKRRHFGFVHW